MDLGTGIAVASGALTVGSIAIVIIPKMISPRTNGAFSQMICNMKHDQLDKRLIEIKDEIHEVRRLLMEK